MKAYLYLSKKNINAKGLCPIVCRIASRTGERVDFRTGKFAKPDEWDNKRGMPAVNDLQIITSLHQVLNTVYALINECKIKGNATVYEVLAAYKQLSEKQPATISEIAATLIEDYKCGKDTTLKITIVAEQFDRLMKKPNPARVTNETLSQFIGRLQAEGFAATTISKKFEFLKRVFVYATVKKYINNNPFDLFKMPSAPKLDPIQLTVDEIDRLQKHNFASGRLNKVKDFFLFQCYTGLSYSDLWVFSKASLQVNSGAAYLSGRRVKTDEVYFLPWLPEAAAIADKYNYHFEHITNQKYNSYLKEIAAITNIDKKLSTHVGRKTFAQMMIDRGYSAEAVSRMVGHASFNMTQKHYAKIGAVRIINETVKMAS